MAVVKTSICLVLLRGYPNRFETSLTSVSARSNALSRFITISGSESV